MLYKVLYTHQKVKKQKTWQDGFLQTPSTGHKAVLLSDDRKHLDFLYIGTGEELSVGRTLESDKFLIEVDEKYVISEKIAEEAVLLGTQSSLPRIVRSVTVKRQNLTSLNKRKKEFKPPFMSMRHCQTSGSQNHHKFQHQNGTNMNDQGDLACGGMSHLPSQHEKSESLSECQNLRISEYQSLSEYQNMKPRTNYDEMHWSEANSPLFCDPVSSFGVESEVFERGEYRDNNSNAPNVADIGEQFIGSSIALGIDKNSLDNAFEMERKDRISKRSTDQIVALFSKRQRCLSSDSFLNKNEFKKGMEDQHQMEYNKAQGSHELPLKTEDSLCLADDSNINLYAANKGNFVHGAVTSRIVKRPITEFSKVEENEVIASKDDKSTSSKTSGELTSNDDDALGGSSLEREFSNNYSCSTQAPVYQSKQIAKPIKPTYSRHSNKVMRLTNGKSISSELLFPSLNDCEMKPIPTRMTQIPVEFRNFLEYKAIFKSALIEHLNIILFDIAKTYHAILKKVKIDIASPLLANSDVSFERRPSCTHGTCTLQTVKKSGPSAGKLFYRCPQTGPDQCKFFMWAEDYQKKIHEKEGEKNVEAKMTISDSECASNFFNGQGVKFYCGCKFVTKQKDLYKSRGNPKWGKCTRFMLDDESFGQKRSIFLTLPFRASSSSYSKDDLWIVSKNFNFDPLNTFIAKSSFYGPNSSGEVELAAVSSYYPSNWQSGETVHAILACNAGMEISCIENLDKINAISDVPILKYLIHSDVTSRGSCLSLNNRFTCPSAISTGENLFTKENINAIVDETIVNFFLNEDQASALRKIANMVLGHSSSNEDDHQIALIHGIFGAGKSFLLAVVILCLVEIFENNFQQNPYVRNSWKILISSSTNVAVDRVLQGLLDLGFEDFVRVGSVKKIAKEVLPYSVHASGTDNQELKELQSMLKSDLSKQDRMLVRKSIEKHRLGLNKKKLREALVVGVTCAASIFPCLDNLSFKIHLLDECSQMTEPLSMLPIARFNCEKLILVGDPKQLSPTIQGSEASSMNGLERTLFDRLTLKGMHPILLKTQYRCHPMISAIPNVLFYKGELRDGVLEDDRASLHDWLNPVCFYNVSKGKEKCGADGSFYNLEEAEFVAYLINAMLLCGASPSDIGVITQYKSQVQNISSLLLGQSAISENQELKCIQISTVDAFQGAEKEIIILSCVRTDHMGFIDCERRTNVALTRAKRHLLIVGNLRILVQNPLWSNVIECCSRSEQGITSAKAFREKMEPIITEKQLLHEQSTSNKGSKKAQKRASSQRDISPV